MGLTTPSTPKQGRSLWLIFRNLSILVEIAGYMGTKDIVNMALAKGVLLRDVVRIFPPLRRTIEDERRRREDERRAVEDERRKEEDERRREEDKRQERRDSTQALEEGGPTNPPPLNAMEWAEEDLEARKQHFRQSWTAEGHNPGDIEKVLLGKVWKNTRMTTILEKHREWIDSYRGKRLTEARLLRPSKLGSIWDSWGKSQFQRGEITARGLLSFPKWRNVYAKYPDNPAIVAYLDFDAESEPPEDKLTAVFPNLLGDYTTARQDEHRRVIIPSTHPGPRDSMDPLELATSVFVPPSRWERRENMSVLTGHPRRLETVFVGWNTLSVVEFTMGVADSTVIPCTFDRWLSSVSSALVTLCNRYPSVATVEDMDKVDERFCCELCIREAIRISPANKGVNIHMKTFTWRAALSHARVTHYGSAPDGIFRLLSQTSKQDHLLAFVREFPDNEPQGEQHCVWLCGHCPNGPKPRPVKVDEILMHMARMHPKLAKPRRGEDYFLDEHRRPRFEHPVSLPLSRTLLVLDSPGPSWTVLSSASV